jgi:hypothetical protein
MTKDGEQVRILKESLVRFRVPFLYSPVEVKKTFRIAGNLPEI